MIKKIKTKAFKDRLRGHKDGIITLYSPEGPQSGMLLSASKDGCIRGKFPLICIKNKDKMVIFLKM